MLNFKFYNPTEIVFGKGQMKQLDGLVPKNSRVLITYGGGSVKKFGTLDKVIDELKKSKREVFEFGGIEPNPKFETLMKAVKLVREEKIDFILAVGGGSVMDGTKFIGIASCKDEYIGKEEELLSFGFRGVPVERTIPFGTVVTLPATGSEMNNGAVISHGKDKLVVSSSKSFPIFSILDPELTYTLPKTQIANGIVDTFIHTVEQYVTYPVDAKFQDRTAEGILQTLIEIGEETIENPTNYEARANLVWSATMGLNGLIGAGVPQDWSVHMIGHDLTAIFGVDHAKTLATILPATWKVRKAEKFEKLLQYAERVWNLREGSDEEKVDSAIKKTEEFFHSLGITTKLSDHGIGEDDIDNIIGSLKSHGMVKLSERGDQTLEITREILEEAL
ncbi:MULTISPECIES: iron-containing alcohol dehydrogenase [Psychrilyobacter]|uniref:Iron-containing alcohol dehydrogenase n=1 Tax=Psychrilyobacter piezotolerans TaxID=2293438 RepID=A0ABX9KGV4_9FUSO|nr:MULTISPECIES: iron-containing alcohol dehydrogenase [Psychrilyobacter]MCS5420702.1 iron-containing alcohol dehydrogenase [Psychrilyobacter sp. S5]NDI78022.1 iron-containing alcohol dehydrogenase [Psychrilyobacter piezotolerans]RDE61961.1 iron-containing alcohol dehydrogenase [Psychrilyobacter sp. S5]REI41187.1 iron-containing alcohol dehydrogenase [Psychrilyobacter piezotolerans]